MAEVRSCCVGAGTELVPGPVNLHELPGINGETWDGQRIQYVKGRRQKPLLPVPPELPDDVLDVVLVNQDVVFHDGLEIYPFFSTVKNLLLVMERDLGVRDKDGWDEGMGRQACRAAHTLDRKPDKDGVKPDRTAVMAITDEASFLPAGTFNHMELQSLHQLVIINLGKTVAFLKDNCYHSIDVEACRDLPW